MRSASNLPVFGCMAGLGSGLMARDLIQPKQSVEEGQFDGPLNRSFLEKSFLFQAIPGRGRMRKVGLSVAAIVLMVAALPTQARDISKNDLEVCKWGSGMASAAQQSKLSGTTLYSARKKLQARKFSKPWMRKMALGITEQTYKSPSRLKPAAVKQTYYDGCIQHDLARK